MKGGQGMVEYTLLPAFVCLASAALSISESKNVSGIWGAGRGEQYTVNRECNRKNS